MIEARYAAIRWPNRGKGEWLSFAVICECAWQIRPHPRAA